MLPAFQLYGGLTLKINTIAEHEKLCAARISLELLPPIYHRQAETPAPTAFARRRQRLLQAELLNAPTQHLCRKDGIVLTESDLVRIKMRTLTSLWAVESAKDSAIAVDFENSAA